MSDRKNRKTTNEKPVSLNPVGFDNALRGLLAIPLSEEPKEEEREKAKSQGNKKSKTK